MNNLASSLEGSESTLEKKKIWLLKQISHSSLLTYHSCPRKFQLDKLRGEEEAGEETPGNIHHAFGHAVGAGIQQAFYPGKTIEDCYLAAFLAWDCNLFDEMERNKKSFWYALSAIDAAWHLAASLKKEGWELAWFDLHSKRSDGEIVAAEPRPAIEFSFAVTFPSGFRYRGYIDIILFNPKTGKYKIIEVKTTGSNYISEAQFGNSPQALSYAIILDWLVKDLSSFDVLYLVYKSKVEEWETLPYIKSSQLKAEWIRNVLHDQRTITHSIEDNYFPKHGESCFDFFQPCRHFGKCGYSDEFLGLSSELRISKSVEREEGKIYDIDIRLEDLLKHQLLVLEEDA